METKFKNVDLEIKSYGRPHEIELEFERVGALMLFSGEVNDGYLSTFEVALDMGTPDEVVFEFSRLIGSFSEKAKLEWNEAIERAFDLGYESTGSSQITLNEETMRIIDDMKGIVRHSIY